MNSLPNPDLKTHLTQLLSEALTIVAPDTVVSIELERPKRAQHGDFACNLAMQLAKPLRRNPRDIAAALLDALPTSVYVAKAEIAGAGFINFYLHAATKQQVVTQILKEGNRYGHGTAAQGKKVQVEFVSANPTGPLHVGHGRGAAFGASLAKVLTAAGYTVTSEYYVNDAGRQMDILALSTWLRYLELHGINVPFPSNAYQGDYVKNMAQQIHTAHQDRYVHQPWTILQDVPSIESTPDGHLDGLIANAKQLLGQDYGYIHDLVLTEQLGDGRNDLLEFGVQFDSWFSEKSLFDNGMVERVVNQLESTGHLYEQDGAKWFRSTKFGDEKDRVVLRENGIYTYFASDIAYHLNKYERGFDRIIDVWGADHHGYIPRVTGALQALGLDPAKLTVALVQFAVLYRDGKKASMSTRSGEFVTLRELRKEVGNDAARFFYVVRKSDQHLDFDLDLAKSQSNENPVYYIQYAHARVCSVLQQWGGDISSLVEADTSLLNGTHELTLLQRLNEYTETLEVAAKDLAPHLIAYYLKDLASDFHSYYNAEQFLVDDEPIRLGRLALITATREILRSGLTMLGVSCPEKM